MKRLALSLKQPWAALLVAGVKTVEVRRWATAYRGPVLIHAARVDDERPEAWALVTPELQPLAERRRGIVGEGELVECRVYRDREGFAADAALHRNDPSWFEERGLCGFCFRGLRTLPFVELPGFVRLFEVEWEDAKPTPPAGVADRLAKLMRGLGS